ncbi:M23 family metallopeptidase [Brevundimonas variabilis]|uniref:Murein DD-endopeptidase MepM/ murein hydrolase activator NlpD n=1 Tax=Brevundimonas variabilis TaxID=74312 RepID=A0A7W9CJN3_9CAUL|nr:M23 family metallopeptidase [Brevundimonas variabilis]MBB5746417.1 murein DD-endopeptidase MepM/ murein hydrolase activator NlpD [Brevundimonas variabilis]
MTSRLTALRSHLVLSVQAIGLLAVAVLAMAAAPLTPDLEGSLESGAVPTAIPVIAELEAAGPVYRQIAFAEPVRGFAVNSRFGMRRLGGEPEARIHKGVDIAAPTGTSVFAATEGRVLRTGYQPEGYGRFVELEHPNGMTTLYAHLSRIDVAGGQTVMASQRVGLVGSTGFSTGPHLHFEVRRNGAQINPAKVTGRTFAVKMDLPAG